MENNLSEQKRLRLNLIENSKGNNWGQRKGGLLSKGSLKAIHFPDKCKELAEFVGIVLGDGNIYPYINGKISVYNVRIAGDFEKDRDYHIDYILPLSQKLFNTNARIRIHTNNERFVCFDRKELITFLLSIGLKSGDKIKNQVGIPTWIFENNEFLKACLRGLIDTDGSIHRMSRQDWKLLRIDFTNHNMTLLNDVRVAFIKLGFNPSKIINNRKICLSRKKDIVRYLKEIGFSNNKHKKRLQSFSPVV